jgi:2-C-methyl-D-erythritol 2,4-cyclodiphosphate synthase
MPFRIGLGQDSHRFVKEGDAKKLVLGGIVVEGERGLEANSDGDVILHALCNALSQAVGKKSLGSYADKLCLEKGVKDSAEYLKVAKGFVDEAGYEIVNIGIMIEGRKPKIEPIADKMKTKIGEILGIDEGRIGITATTGEYLTSFGKGEGIQVFAVTILVHKHVHSELKKHLKKD